MSTALQTLTTKLATKLDMGDNGQELIEALKSTAFKGNVSDAQMTALMVIANQYGLNPWTKEIYAFPDQRNGIVPVVGVDGWSRILNEHPEFDGIEFQQDDKSCTAIIYRKDRSHATKVTEYLSECSRNTGPWQSHPKRMLRHKALIQGARIAMGYTGIYDQDEAEAIVHMGDAEVVGKPAAKPAAKAAAKASRTAVLPDYPESRFRDNFPGWQAEVLEGKTTPTRVINRIAREFTLSHEQVGMIRAMHVPDSTVVATQAPQPEDDWASQFEEEAQQ